MIKTLGRKFRAALATLTIVGTTGAALAGLGLGSIVSYTDISNDCPGGCTYEMCVTFFCITGTTSCTPSQHCVTLSGTCRKITPCGTFGTCWQCLHTGA